MLLKTTRVSKYGLLKDYVMSRFKLHFLILRACLQYVWVIQNLCVRECLCSKIEMIDHFKINLVGISEETSNKSYFSP